MPCSSELPCCLKSSQTTCFESRYEDLHFKAVIRVKNLEPVYSVISNFKVYY